MFSGCWWFVVVLLCLVFYLISCVLLGFACGVTVPCWWFGWSLRSGLGLRVLVMFCSSVIVSVVWLCVAGCVLAAVLCLGGGLGFVASVGFGVACVCVCVFRLFMVWCCLHCLLIVLLVSMVWSLIGVCVVLRLVWVCLYVCVLWGALGG